MTPGEHKAHNFLVYVPSDRQPVTIRELKRPVHKWASVCEIEEILANRLKISRIYLPVRKLEDLPIGRNIYLSLLSVL